MLPHEIEKQILESVEEIEEFGTKYAKARGISYQMQEMRKVILSSCINKEDRNLSENKRENLARCREDYTLHLKGTSQAITNELAYKAKYEKSKAKYEALRSLMSLSKKQMEI